MKALTKPQIAEIDSVLEKGKELVSRYKGLEHTANANYGSYGPTRQGGHNGNFQSEVL